MLQTKNALIKSIIALVLCIAMLTGSTFAWFNDSVSSSKNIIQSGKLDIAMYWTDKLDGDNTVWNNVEGDTNTAMFNHDNWEPGYADVRYIKIVNEGNLALNYEITLESEGSVGKLAEVINVYFSEENEENITSREQLSGFTSLGLLNRVMNGEAAGKGTLLASGQSNPYYKSGETIVTLGLSMLTTAGNEYQNETIGEGGFKIKALATQCPFESDSFGADYDGNAEMPESIQFTEITFPLENGVIPTGGIELVGANGVRAFVPDTVKVAEGAKELKLTVKPLKESTSGITAVNSQVLIPVDVHMEGVAEDNQTAIPIDLGPVMPKYLNFGNYKLIHVEDGVNQEMTCVADRNDLNDHNDFTYDPVTGEVTLALESFSEITVVADTENAWNGEFDYDWYTKPVAVADDEGDADYVIANADQLAAFGAIVGGMNGQTKDSFKDKTVKLLSDINLGDAEENNKALIFYPIGYYNSTGSYEKKSDVSVTCNVSSFEGTFDGNGHTIANFYQNTWEMFGDYNDGYSGKPNHYKDGMGLFGYVLNGAVKNLTVSNFSSDGEYTPTGVIAAYAVNSTFENIAITNCNPRVYNTGNGGIIGIGGNDSDPDTYKLTFTNITIDNSNKISALWGSWDVACGGLVGMFRGKGHVYMTNCHVAAQIDVYNDVCGNYQYYWYRYSGMMVGTNKNMITDKDGYTVPETSKFHAENCTVHFGNWNDYYYCELVANSLASYTHDHQFSRLTEISSLDEIKSGDIWTKTGNFLLISDDTKTCYHIVNKNGTLTQHLHTDAGEEIVNGKTVLKEDNQIIYLPFNQLFTGYGWGVKHIPVYNGEDYAFEGITILDREVAGSAVKFNKADTAKDSYSTESTVTIGELFTAATIDDTKLSIKKENVQVTVSPVGNDSTAGGKYTANTSDWTQGTLTFSGTGEATITITDYYFCTPTTINVTVTEKVAAEKFETKFTGDFLYRVGNAENSPVKLDSLFKAIKGAKIGTVDVTIEAVDGTTASGVYTSKATWTDSIIQFKGTGVVKVTIKDDDVYCKPTELYLEIINATNITSKTNATEKDVVLLNDITGGFTVSNGHTFHGNGFKVNCSGDGSYRSAAVSYGFITVETGGVLDNTQIICDIFPESYVYTSEMNAGADGRYPYGYSAVVVSGNSSTISNCYIYGARNNIQVGEGNVAIRNTVTECGSLSNIHIKSNNSYTVTLDNLTTIQYQTKSGYDTSKTVLGFGVVVGTNESTSNPTIKLKGVLNQYNWVTSNDTNVSNAYARTAITEALKVDQYKHTINGNTSVNMGITYLNTENATIVDNRTNKNEVPYELSNITMLSHTGQVYSIISRSGITDGEKPGEYNPETSVVVMPELSLNKELGVTFASEYDSTSGSWTNVLSVDLDNIDGGSYDFKFNKLKVKKYGIELDYSVKDSDGNSINNDATITLNGLATKEYTLEITDNLIYNANGEKIEGKVVSHKVPFTIKATKTSIEPPKFANAGTATAIRLVEKKGGDWRPAYTALTGVSVTYWSASERKVKTIDLSTLYNSGTISSNVWTYTCDDYTLTITGGQVHSDGTKITPVVSNGTLYFASTNKAFGTGTTSRNIILDYVFTDKNASTTWNRSESVAYSNLSEYDYSKFKNGTLEEPSSGSISPCVTPDTLVTLADGSQKRIDEVTYADQLLVWDFYNGEYVAVSSAIIFNHGYDNNTVIKLKFDDGTEVKVVNLHQFMDADLNKLVSINEESVADYVGHKFVKRNGNGHSTVTLVDYEVSKEYEQALGIISAGHYNIIVADLISADFKIEDYGLFNYFEIGEDMKFDADKMQADIEKYGLYTYEDFAEYLTPEQFAAFNVPYFKIAVGKGNYTYEGILNLIEEYLNN